jgi:hypothetical protein
MNKINGGHSSPYGRMTTPDPSAGSGEDSLGGATQNTFSYTFNDLLYHNL